MTRSNPNTAQLVPSRGPRTGDEVTLTASRTTLGRDRDCDIVLNGAATSSHHAELHRDKRGCYTLIDTGSLTGVYLNRRATQHAHLADGDEIRIGTSRFIFHLPLPSATLADTAATAENDR